MHESIKIDSVALFYTVEQLCPAFRMQCTFIKLASHLFQVYFYVILYLLGTFTSNLWIYVCYMCTVCYLHIAIGFG